MMVESWNVLWNLHVFFEAFPDEFHGILSLNQRVEDIFIKVSEGIRIKRKANTFEYYIRVQGDLGQQEEADDI